MTNHSTTNQILVQMVMSDGNSTVYVKVGLLILSLLKLLKPLFVQRFLILDE